MATGAIEVREARGSLELGTTGRRAATAAAALTVGGAAALGAFFTVGEPWGTINDTTSIVLAWSTLPVAIDLVRRNARAVPFTAGAAANLAGVAIVTTFTSLLITRRMTFDESLIPIMIGQSCIGAWLVLVGLAGWSDPGSRRAAALGILGGSGLIAMTVGIATDGASQGMQSPLAAVGFVASLIGTVGCYALLGRRRTT